MGKIHFPDVTTYGEKYGPAMKIEDSEQGQMYLAACIDHQMRIGGYSREEAEHIERNNIGYWAGYYDEDTRLRVERVFGIIHPIFGSMPHKPIIPW